MKKLALDELGRISIDSFKNASKTSIAIVLDNVRSLHNVGSAFRTADSFRIEKIFLTGITGTPPHREIQKTALGATESVAWEYDQHTVNVARRMKDDGYKIVIVEQTDVSVPLHSFQPSPNEKYCLIFGNEVNGVSDDVLPYGDVALEIPQEGTKHSLNISVCLGIVVWELFRKMKLQNH